MFCPPIIFRNFTGIHQQIPFPVRIVSILKTVSNYQCRLYRSCLSEIPLFTTVHNRSFFSTVWGKLIPRKMIGNTRFNTSIRFGEDALFMAQISSRVQDIKLTSASAIYFRRIYSLSSSRLKNSLYTELSNCLKLFANYLFLLIRQLGKNQFWFLSLRMLAFFKGSSRRIRMAIIQ